MESIDAVKKVFVARTRELGVTWGVIGLIIFLGFVAEVINIVLETKEGSAHAVIRIIMPSVLCLVFAYSITYMVLHWLRVQFELMESGDLRVTNWLGRKETYSVADLRTARVLIGNRTRTYVTYSVLVGRRSFSVNTRVSDFSELMTHILTHAEVVSPDASSALALLMYRANL